MSAQESQYLMFKKCHSILEGVFCEENNGYNYRVTARK